MTLLIDADDTLWENITVFYAINERYAQWVAPDLDAEQIGLDLDQIQKSFVGTYGYGRETFEHSLIEGVRRFAIENRAVTIVPTSPSSSGRCSGKSSNSTTASKTPSPRSRTRIA